MTVAGPPPSGCPYVGLSFYTERQADVFFGRETERRIIIANLRASRLTLLHAQSGVGKSSLLRAGVTSRLRHMADQSRAERGFPRHIPVVFSSWRDDPVGDLTDAIRASVTEFAPDEDVALPRNDLADAIVTATALTRSTLLIILDQFEDYLLYRSRETPPGAMAAQLAACINRADLRANFLIAVREDAYAGIGELFEGRVENIYGNFLHLDYLDREAGREAIEQPLIRLRATNPGTGPSEIEPALVDEVLDQVRAGQVLLEQSGHGTIAAGEASDRGDDEIETPYLQLVMTTLWEHEHAAGSARLRLSTLEELGGAQDIVRAHLDTALTNLTDDERAVAADLFHHLVTPSGTKIAHAVPDLADYTGHSVALLDPLIEKLAGGDRRILRLVPGGEGGQPRVEIFHDVLAPAILGWRTRQAAGRLQREKDAAQGRERDARRRARLFLAVALGAVALLAVAIVAVVFAETQRSRADHARRQSESAVLAGDGFRNIEQGPLDAGILLSLAAYQTAPSPAARDDLVTSLVSTQRMAGYFAAQSGPVNKVAFDPAGDVVASGGADGTIVLWNIRTRRRRTLAAGSEAVNSLAFNRDGTVLASGGDDGTVVLWDVSSGHRLHVLNGSAGAVYDVAFNPTANMLASAQQDGRIILWNPRAGHRIRTLVGHEGATNAVAFDSAGTLLASAQADGSVIVWNLATGRRHTLVVDRHNAVNAVAFSPVGGTLAAGDQDGKVYLYDVRTERRPDRVGVLRNFAQSTPAGPIESVAFSPDGATIACAGADAFVWVWNVDAQHVTQTFQGQANTIESVAFSPNGKLIASGSDDHSVILFDTALSGGVERFVTRRSAAFGIAVNPSADLVASANQDGTVSVWNRTTGRQRVLRADDGILQGIAFSHDGRELLAAGSRGHVVIWSVPDFRRRRTLRAPGSNDLWSVAVSPDGNTVAAGNDKGDVLVWNVVTGRLVHELAGHSGTVFSVAFSPDGTKLAAGDADGTVVVTDLLDGQRVTLTGHTQAVYAVSFSPDGDLVASGGADRTIVLSSVRTGRQVGSPLRGHQSDVNAVAFSPDGRSLASGGSDHAVIVWDLADRLGQVLTGHADVVTGLAYSADGRTLATSDSTGTLIVYRAPATADAVAVIDRRLCSVVQNLTRQQWSQAAPTEPYRRPCPGDP
jgi:WD40 repeat protein